VFAVAIHVRLYCENDNTNMVKHANKQQLLTTFGVFVINQLLRFRA